MLRLALLLALLLASTSAAPLPPKFAKLELQVQPWNDVSLGPFSAPTKVVFVKNEPSSAGLLAGVSEVALTG